MRIYQKTDLTSINDSSVFPVEKGSGTSWTTYSIKWSTIKEKLKTYFDNLYVAKVDGKGLSTEDYTTVEKNKLAGLSNVTLSDDGGILL